MPILRKKLWPGAEPLPRSSLRRIEGSGKFRGRVPCCRSSSLSSADPMLLLLLWFPELLPATTPSTLLPLQVPECSAAAVDVVATATATAAAARVPRAARWGAFYASAKTIAPQSRPRQGERLASCAVAAGGSERDRPCCRHGSSNIMSRFERLIGAAYRLERSPGARGAPSRRKQAIGRGLPHC